MLVFRKREGEDDRKAFIHHLEPLGDDGDPFLEEFDRRVEDGEHSLDVAWDMLEDLELLDSIRCDAPPMQWEEGDEGTMTTGQANDGEVSHA
jgi:hypothetical protein